MEIDFDSYKLSKDNYVPQGTKKDKIVIGSTYSTNMRHFKGWTTRHNGNFTRTAMFTIRQDGQVIQHFSPNYFSDYMIEPEVCEKSIVILLENEGWLTKDLINENKYIDYVGHIYNRGDEVVEKRWRNQRYWAPFTDDQVESTVNLVNELCEGFEIPREVVEHNTNFDEAEEFSGIMYRSNFKKYYTDISPAWDCVGFKNKIEKQI